MRIATTALGLLLLSLPVAACHRGAAAPAKAAQAPAAAPAQGAANAAGEAATAPAAWQMPEPDLGYNAREGRALYEHYCSTCHGSEGHGDGFNSFNLDPKPRDLGDPAFQAKRTDEELATVIRSGGAAAGLSSGMPPWGRTLNARQIGNLVAYLRTLKPAEN
jgi:mono/diheme cytochrome c family protein